MRKGVIGMDENIKFSVSMCVYGRDNARWFETAIESVLNQTLPPNEIVLVVDGPVPHDLNAVIFKLEENDIFKVIRLETNQGHIIPITLTSQMQDVNSSLYLTLSTTIV